MISIVKKSIYKYLFLFLISLNVAYADINKKVETVNFINDIHLNNKQSKINNLYRALSYNPKYSLFSKTVSDIENSYYRQNNFILTNRFKNPSYSNNWNVTGEETWHDSDGVKIDTLNIAKTGQLTVSNDLESIANVSLKINKLSSDNGELILDTSCLCSPTYFLEIGSFNGNLSLLKVIGGEEASLVSADSLSISSILVDNSTINFRAGNTIKNLDTIDLKGSSTLNVIYGLNKDGGDSLLQAKKLNVQGNAFLSVQQGIATVSDSVNLKDDNTSLKVEGTLKTNDFNTTDSSKVEVLLNANSDKIEAQQLTTSGDFTLKGSGTFTVSDALNASGVLTVDGGSLQTKDLNVQDKSLEINGNLNISNAINIDGYFGTNLNISYETTLEAKYLSILGWSDILGNLNIKEDVTVKGNSTNNGSLKVNNILQAKNLNIEEGSSVTFRSKGSVISNDINMSNNSTLNIDIGEANGILQTNVLNVSGLANLLGKGSLNIIEDLNLANGSTLKIDGEMKTKGLKAEGDASLDGKGSLNITEGLSLGSGSKLSIKNSVETKDLSIGEGSELTNLQNLKVAANTVMGNNSTLNVSGTMDTLGINLGDNTILSVSGVLTAGTGGINVDGKSQMRVDNIINTDSINIGKEGSLSIINEGTLNINSSLININGGVLDLTNTSANMLKAIGINNASGVLNIGSNELNLKEYNGNVNSKINLDIVKDNSGKLNVSNDFKLIDGSINLNVKDPIDYREGVSYVIVTANNVTLQGNNLFVFDDIKYQLIPQIVDGKAIEVTLKEASLKDDILCSSGAVSDYCNIAANLQSVIDNNLGNEDFNKYLSVIIADSQNRYYNILQLKPISSTTKKEINSVIAGEFNNLVMDRMYSSNLDNETEFEFNSIYKKDNSQIMEGINLWGSLGGSVATIKGDSLGGSEAGSQGMQTIEGVVGADYSFQPNIQLGLALGSGSTSGKNKEDIERFVNNSVSYSGLVYGNYKTGNYYVSNNISYTAISNDNTRDVNIPLNPKNNKESSTDGVISVINESGIFTDVGSFMKINSFIKGEYTDYTLSGYKEEGTGFGLSFNDTNYKDLIVGAGVRLIGDMQYYYSLINPMIELSYERKLNKDALNGQMSFANANSGTINITEDSYSQDKIKLKVGLDYKYSQSIGFSLKVQQEFNKQINSLGANIDMNYKF